LPDRPKRRRPNGLDKARGAWDQVRAELRLAGRLSHYARAHLGRLVLAWLAMCVYAAAGALLAYAVKPIFDEVLIQGINAGRISAMILGLYVLKGIGAYFSTTLVAAAGHGAVTDLRNDLYEHILAQPYSFLSRNSTGSLMSHITTDVERVQAAVSEVAGDLLKEGLTVVGLLIVLFAMDWRLALVAIVGMPLAFHPLVH
jgi:subfamily B ATP-binding cassette protein MsbA